MSLKMDTAISMVASASVMKQVVTISVNTLKDTFGSKDFQDMMANMLKSIDLALKSLQGDSVSLGALMSSQAGLNVLSRIMDMVLSQLQLPNRTAVS